MQHSINAEADRMPLAALSSADTDHVAAAADLARIISDVARSDAESSIAASETLALDVEIASGECGCRPAATRRPGLLK